MATYDELVDRIEVATVKLEADVVELDAFVEDIQNAVDGEIQELLQQAVDASNTATAAAATSTTQAANASASAAQAQATADALLATAPFQEAPQNGQTYGRNNGAWVLVEGGGEGGSVVSVNGELPDAQGNVTIAIPDSTSDLTNDSGFITAADVPTATSELTNDSGFITAADIPAPAIATDAPADGKQYARQDNAWTEVVSSGGGGSSYTYPSPAVVEPDWTFDFITNPVLAAGLVADYNNATSQTFLPTAENGWTQNGSVPLTTNPFLAVDIRAVNVVRVRTDGARDSIVTNEIVNDFNPAIGGFEYFIQTLGPRQAFFDASTNGFQLKKAMLPGKYFVPAGFTTGVSGGGFPASMVGFPALMEVTQVANRRHILITFMPGVGGGSVATASKLTYFWDYQSNTWKNLGTGTA